MNIDSVSKSLIRRLVIKKPVGYRLRVVIPAARRGR
jgi:hypothetical protein